MTDVSVVEVCRCGADARLVKINVFGNKDWKKVPGGAVLPANSGWWGVDGTTTVLSYRQPPPDVNHKATDREMMVLYGIETSRTIVGREGRGYCKDGSSDIPEGEITWEIKEYRSNA